MHSKLPDWLIWTLENSSVTTDARSLKGIRLASAITLAPFAFIRTALLCLLVTPALVAELLSSKK